MILSAQCQSLTGELLYSDTFCYYPFRDDDEPPAETIKIYPIINRIEAIPFFGPLGGAFRLVLAIIHMIGHAVACLIYRNKEHLIHVAKGATEALRGIIAMIPIVGRIFVWFNDLVSGGLFGFSHRSFFIIKIYRPDCPDYIDRCIQGEGGHPYLPQQGLYVVRPHGQGQS